MKYFIDSEFAEAPGQIALISLAIVSEDGREFYVEVADFDESLANDWVKANVLPNLWSNQMHEDRYAKWGNCDGGLIPYAAVAPAVLAFVRDENPEFWGYYSAYDWVALCWLFGAMVDLPKGWPMFCYDLQQVMLQFGRLPKHATEESHNALDDAMWIKREWEYLNVAAHGNALKLYKL
jgi:3' exoribonuclease, RNase T-like